MRTTKHDTSAISLTEVTLIAIIIALIALIGGFIVHTKQQVAKELAFAAVNATTIKRLTDCQLADKTTKGVTYSAPFSTYSVCIPNGWKVYRAPGSTAASSALISSDITYRAKIRPVIGNLTDGKDGPSPFAIYYSQPVQTIDKSFTKVAAIKTATVTGTEYYFKQTTRLVNPGLEGYELGTIVHIYYFEQAGHSVELVHVVLPNASDQAGVVRQMAASLQIN